MCGSSLRLVTNKKTKTRRCFGDVPRCVRDVSEMCPRCARNVSEMCPRCVRDVSETVSETVSENLSETVSETFPRRVLRRVRDVSETCPKPRDVSETCPERVRDVSETCPCEFDSHSDCFAGRPNVPACSQVFLLLPKRCSLTSRLAQDILYLYLV